MKKNVFASLVGVCVLLAMFSAAGGCAQTPSKYAVKDAAKLNEPTVRKSQSGLRHLVYLPRGYDAGNLKKRWPVLIYLHGVQARGERLSLVRSVGVAHEMEQGRDFGMIVVVPQISGREAWNARKLEELLDEAEADYHVDVSRVYVTGDGIGGYGTYVLAGRAPQRFAAAAPISSAAYVEQSVQLRDVPMWVFHGKLDGIVPLDQATDMVYALSTLGGEAHVTVYEKGDHDIAERVYSKDELYTWFLKHRRNQETGKIEIKSNETAQSE